MKSKDKNIDIYEKLEMFFKEQNFDPEEDSTLFDYARARKNGKKFGLGIGVYYFRILTIIQF